MVNTQILNDDDLSKINTLLEYLHDSYNGYHESVDDIENSILKSQFSTTASTRQHMITELKQLVQANAENPSKHGTIAGAAHRTFVNLKSLITGKNEESIINEVVRGENFLAEKYQNAISEVHDTNVKQVLTRHVESIKKDLIKWKMTAESFKAIN